MYVGKARCPLTLAGPLPAIPLLWLGQSGSVHISHGFLLGPVGYSKLVLLRTMADKTSMPLCVSSLQASACILLAKVSYLIGPGIKGWAELTHSGGSSYSCLENPMDRGSRQAQSIGLQRLRHD